MLSFGLSLWFFNRGEVFRSAPLAAPPLAYLLVRMCWIGFRGRASAPALFWPVWLLAAVAVFLGGLRVGLNLETPRGVIDVGYAGVIGGDRILDGRAPYGNMPVQNTKRSCGKTDAEGSIRDWVQDNGRCESSLPRGDTYGPVAYLAYVPAALVFPWSGKWDSLPAAHATAIVFDLLVVLGLVLVGPSLRRPAARGGARLRLDGLPVHRVCAELEHERRDHARDPRLGLLALDLARGAWCRRCSLGVDEVRDAPPGTSLAHVPERPVPACGRAVRERGSSSRRWQPSRFSSWSRASSTPRGRSSSTRSAINSTAGSPFSPWDWGQYHARGIPDLAAVQLILQVGVLALAGVVAVIPQRKGPLELAALSAAVLIGFELALTHWSYLYIPWFLPFVLVALLLAPAGGPVEKTES